MRLASGRESHTRCSWHVCACASARTPHTSLLNITLFLPFADLTGGFQGIIGGKVYLLIAESAPQIVGQEREEAIRCLQIQSYLHLCYLFSSPCIRVSKTVKHLTRSEARAICDLDDTVSFPAMMLFIRRGRAGMARATDMK